MSGPIVTNLLPRRGVFYASGSPLAHAQPLSPSILKSLMRLRCRKNRQAQLPDLRGVAQLARASFSYQATRPITDLATDGNWP